jgi:DNA-binding CsgD family transcriptional regulator
MGEFPSAADVMKVLDAAYDVGQPRDRWLSGVLHSMTPTFDRGAGVGGLLYDISRDGQIQVERMEGINVSSGFEQVGLAMHRDSRFTQEIIARYRSSLCATLPQLFEDPRLLGSMRRDFYDHHQVAGQIMINGIDCSGKGCVLYVFSPRTLALSDGQRDLFSRLATHVSTAYRLQRQLAGTDPAVSPGVEAVLSPSGHVDHAEAGARSAGARRELELAVRHRERARDFTDKDAQRVVRSLKGMVDARWTLVDHYETGGRRYILARENAPKPVAPARLSQRERQVVALASLGRTNKLIAYELGLAQSTVRVLMARAGAKLGATSRHQLVARQQASASR